MFNSSFRRAFTLIELLVVIAIIAILAVVVVLVLNPAQLLAQGRDANRLSDAATLKNALGIYSEDIGGNLGSSSIVYVSIPDPAATSSAGDQCQGLGLPSLGSSSSTYQCASSSTYRNINGTGWIPLNFNAISFGSPISSLPVDPINTNSSGEYYTYEASGTTYEITMALEANKDSTIESNDGGQYSNLYETGNNLALAPVDFYSLSTKIIAPANLRASDYGTSTISSVSASWPAGAAVGDLMIFCTSGGYTPSLPSGWTSLFSVTGTTWNAICGSKILNSTDITTGSLTISYSGSYDNVLSLYDFVGSTGGVREAEGVQGFFPSSSPGSLTTTANVTHTDVGIYYASCRQGGVQPANLTLGGGSATQLQFFLTTNSNNQMWFQVMPGGAQTNTLYYSPTSCNDEGVFAQIIIKGS